jgi:hypothetical protein
VQRERRGSDGFLADVPFHAWADLCTRQKQERGQREHGLNQRERRERREEAALRAKYNMVL